MKTEIVNGITCKVERGDEAPSQWKSYESIQEMVKDMTNRDVLYKFAAIDGKRVTVQIEKTDEANDNWYENEMRVSKNTPELPTNMFK